jgi:hypothetical protein
MALASSAADRTRRYLCDPSAPSARRGVERGAPAVTMTSMSSRWKAASTFPVRAINQDLERSLVRTPDLRIAPELYPRRAGRQARRPELESVEPVKASVGEDEL